MHGAGHTNVDPPVIILIGILIPGRLLISEANSWNRDDPAANPPPVQPVPFAANEPEASEPIMPIMFCSIGVRLIPMYLRKASNLGKSTIAERLPERNAIRSGVMVPVMLRNEPERIACRNSCRDSVPFAGRVILPNNPPPVL